VLGLNLACKIGKMREPPDSFGMRPMDVEPILPSDLRKVFVATLKALGTVKMYRIGQSAGRV